MKWLGYGLHCLQDIDAHGQIGAGSGLPQHILNIYKGDLISKADTIKGYEWNSKMNNFIYKKNSLERLFATRDRTYKYLEKFLKRIK